MATIKDVARVSGVSTTTVSFVLNKTGSVGPEARERVLAAAQALGYKANPLARAMITRKTRSLGVLVNEVNAFVAASMLNGIEETARAAGYEILLALHRDDPGTAVRAIDELSGRRVDAILSVFSKADAHPEVLATLPGLDLPYVIAFYRAPESEGVTLDNIVADQEQGGFLATTHLLKQGRRHIAFVGGPPERNATRKRLEGYHQAHQAFGVEPDPALTVFADFLVVPSREAGDRLLRSGEKIDAVFAADDRVGAGLAQALRANQKRVPQDIALVGFNDSELCEAVDPPLTSIRMPLYEIGCQCVERAILRLEHPHDWHPETRVLPCTLTVRGSA